MKITTLFLLIWTFSLLIAAFSNNDLAIGAGLLGIATAISDKENKE